MDSTPTSVNAFQPAIKDSLKDVFSETTIANTLVVLGEIGITSAHLVTALTTLPESDFRECILQNIFDQGRAVVSYPIGDVIKACLWVRMNAQTSEKRKIFSERINKLKEEQTNAETTPAGAKQFQPPILMFSNSREGQTIRALHRGSSSSSSKRVKIESAETDSEGNASHPDWHTLQVRKRCEGKRPITIVQCEPRKMLFQVALLFYNHSKTLKTCYLTLPNTSEIEAFVQLCFSKRCKSVNTMKGVCKFVLEYYNFGMTAEPVTPITGEHAIVPIARWMSELRIRGATVPRAGRYSLRVFGEALGIDFPINHPSILACVRTVKLKPTKHAPPIPIEFIKKLEIATTNSDFPTLKRVFCSIILLQVYASLRYIDTCYVSQIFLSEKETSICGVSIDKKSPNGDVIQWAAPLKGLTDIKWWEPVKSFWERIKPEGDLTKTTPLYTAFDKEWATSKRTITRGIVQAALTKLEKEFGFDCALKIHSPRSWHATLAKQLLYSREDREKLGHWAPGSLMPDLYDRATCATELRLRDEILQRIREGWAPAGPYEVPNTQASTQMDAESSEMESTSVLSETDNSEVNIADLSDNIDFDGTNGFV